MLSFFIHFAKTSKIEKKSVDKVTQEVVSYTSTREKQAWKKSKKAWQKAGERRTLKIKQHHRRTR